ncbi:MAG: amino acid permease [Melioribacteraceae bacterium]|nr:amino acid permease [Melioribacteraceae bacterium]
MIKGNSKSELVRGLGLIAAIMLVAGSMIGSGIFRKPSSIAEQLMSPELMILVWVGAGLITLIGAAINAEISSILPSTGGQFIYFKEMYGKFTAYLYGWSVLAVIQTGSQAAIAYAFAEYVGYFIKFPELPKFFTDMHFFLPAIGDIHPLVNFGTKLIAILVILFLTAVNYVGVVFGGGVQTFVTFVKIATILILSFLLFFFGQGSLSNVYNNFALEPQVSSNLISMIGLALAGAFWAYDGWNNLTFVSGEVKNAQKNVSLGLLFGTLIVIGVYVIINLAYLYVMPIEEIAKSPLVAASAAEKIFGSSGGSIVSIAVIISTFGALNGSILATARVQYAMSENKLFFKGLGKIHPKYNTPHVSLVVQGIWSSVLVLSGSFDTITDYVIFASWLFYMLGAYGVFVLRKKMGTSERYYKVWGYPYTPMIFVIFSFLFLLNSIYADTENAMMGLMLITIGLPFYFYWNKKEK